MKPLMKISLVAASLLATTLSSSAQQNESFKVVKVQGEIHRVKTGNILSIGENVQSNENLSFKDNYSRAMVVNNKKGCMILSANSNNGGPQFLPAPNNMSVRTSLPAQPSEVLDFYYGYVAITGADSLKIDGDKLTIDADSYFTINYEKNGKSVSEKMAWNNGKLSLPSVLMSDKPEKIEICYNNEFGLKKKSEFKPIYVDSRTLREEIRLIFDALQGDKASKITATVSFINDFYGKITPETVESWIDNNVK